MRKFRDEGRTMTNRDRTNRIGSGPSRTLARPRRHSSLHSRARGFEVLEDRQVLSTLAVTSLADSGFGSLRQVILAANAAPGPDTIDFEVAGTIRVGPTSLPAITDKVTIDGTTAPGFAGAPAVTVDFQGTQGLQFNAGSDGSFLKSLSLVRAGSAGVTLNASYVAVQGNYIGVLADGETIAGNRGDGVQINASSHGDLIGNNDPVSSINYYNANSVPTQPVSGWQGIKSGSTPGQYVIVGTSNSNGLLYEGPISGVGGTSFTVNVPGATSSSIYGSNTLPDGTLQLVGSYKNGDGTVHGVLFQGTTADFSNPADYTTIDYPGATYTYVHSTMGGLAVGNADGPEGNAPIGTGHSFLYNIATGTLSDIVYPGAAVTTSYGIWYNGGTSYTIVGGYSNPGEPGNGLTHGYMVDYDRATGQFTHWTSFDAPSGGLNQNIVTHFEGISSSEKGVYTLGATSLQTDTGAAVAEWVSVRRNTDGTFGTPHWVTLNVPTGGAKAFFTSNDSVAGNASVGIVITDQGEFSYQAYVNTGFQLSNVISGNWGNGVGIYGGSTNQVAMNNIGTDVTGTIRLGNAGNGILVTGSAVGNLIGGQATGGNDPTGNVFVRPPQGNLISANGGDGVLITDGPTLTLLSGNFIGTTASGNAALGNFQDGVAIVRADGNALIGCTFPQDPFVFYNVIGGNGGNGVRVTDSNLTTIQANFLGAGANNATVVPNGGDGLLVSGSSANTQVGGVIPLGNVISGNLQNGIEVRDTASSFTSFNTFAGIFAFAGAAPNVRDGILVTSSGGNNLIRTCIVSGNLGNGIEIGGNATGVQVTETAVGTNVSIQSAIPNYGDGILITGNAHGNAIGGFQPSIEPQVTIAANAGYGIEITGSAHDNLIVHTYVGTNYNATAALGNFRGGINLGPGTSSNVIGGPGVALANKILYNGGSGLTIQSSSGNAVLNNQIQFNAASGITVVGGQNNVIGSAGAGNAIGANGLDGLDVTGVVTGTRVQANAISGNAFSGVTLIQARNLVIGGSTPGSGNGIAINRGFGLYAKGLSTGTRVQGNAIAANGAGNVDVTNAPGIVYIP
jgi:hypothetical protein